MRSWAEMREADAARDRQKHAGEASRLYQAELEAERGTADRIDNFDVDAAYRPDANTLAGRGLLTMAALDNLRTVLA